MSAHPPRSGAWWREITTAAVAAALCLLGGAARADGSLSTPPLTAYLIAAVSGAVLPLRRRAPVPVMVVLIGCGLLVTADGLLLSPLTVAPAVFAAYSYALSARSERRTLGAISLAAGILVVASAPWAEGLSSQDISRLAAVAAFPLVAAVFGHSVQNRRAYLTAVEERARRAEQTREDEARRRVAEERMRIARELHDLVAHQITLANAQATVAAHVFDTRPEQTRASLGDLVRTTRHALDDLRATVGLLRQSGDVEAPGEPAPGLAQIPALLESFRLAGLDVSLQQEGAAQALPPAIDLTAYRIVQESLTNVTKHAGTATARVHLTWNPDHVRVEISDAGGPARAERPPGYGLIGMRERATAVGGRLWSGRAAEGGWSVVAHLPVPTATEELR
ncbi:two-component sensor histidine kinase [Kineosporia sp. NBRC 101677]|uniref:sensor histidine kinase n=1 Tax=Kineosporia sp. NBRC 101677 TaxID=3032197 RepID=UPI0024A40305|nr:sensor histidine kinase [Kineosporia sp. NBRC 101677]GLY17203.1 two-component sensor histidine kinase [Kineosporia sp. NBRC 101677]